MTQQEYEQKKRECWEEVMAQDPSRLLSIASFEAVFDRAFALGKLQASCEQVKEEISQEKDTDTVLQGWVCRDKEWDKVLFASDLYLSMEYPTREEWAGTWRGMGAYIPLNTELFPDLTWESDPQECEIIIKRKKKWIKN